MAIPAPVKRLDPFATPPPATTNIADPYGDLIDPPIGGGGPVDPPVVDPIGPPIGGGGPVGPTPIDPPIGGGGPVDPTPDPLHALARKRIMDLLDRGPTSAQDVYNSPAAAAHRLSTQRALEHNVASAAERGAAGGYGSGAIAGNQAGLEQAAAEGNANYTGYLAQHQEDQRIQTLLQGLGLNQQGQQENNRLGFDYTQLQTNANFQALLAALQGGGA